MPSSLFGTAIFLLAGASLTKAWVSPPAHQPRSPGAAGGAAAPSTGASPRFGRSSLSPRSKPLTRWDAQLERYVCHTVQACVRRSLSLAAISSTAAYILVLICGVCHRSCCRHESRATLATTKDPSCMRSSYARRLPVSLCRSLSPAASTM